MKFLRLPPVPTMAVLATLLAGPASMEGQASEVTIDVEMTSEPISPFVYGQFIEHLGRCIYGGLWAEMIEDRKFYYPVTGRAPAWEMFQPGETSWQGEGHPYELLVRSPWLILGDPGKISMSSDRSYVGDHTPRIELSGDQTRGGLIQERLGLLEGRNYIGRIVLAGDAAAAPIEVSLVWGGGASDRETVRIESLTGGFQKYPLEFRAGSSTENGRLEIASQGSGVYYIGTVSVMPADNVSGWRRDTLALLKELDAPVYRWPGGNFVSGYDWKDGIGDPDLRPPRKNPAWTGIESNDVGIHEYMDLCRELGTEAFIAVNTGLGEIEAAAEELEYVNGAADTPMGRLRASNGRPQPFGVKFWAIGNEMYGDWQLGHMPLSEYTRKHRGVVEAMRAVDPSIQTIAVGAAGEWSRTMLSSCADHMELISEHLYWQDKDDLLEHVRQITEGIRRVADAHRDYRRELPSLRGKDIRIALDEWNYWYGPNEYGELGVRYFLQDALGIAAGLHEMFRNSDLFYMANYAQTVNVIGAIKTSPNSAELEPTGLVLALYRQRFGTTPVAVTGAPPTMDVAAAWNSDRSAVTVALVNISEASQTVDLALRGAEPTGKQRRWLLTGADRFAHNAPGKERGVEVYETSRRDGTTRLEVPSLSIILYELEVSY